MFCKIVRGEIPCKLVREGDDLLAFRDINPQAPAHLLIIPKEHYSQISDVRDPKVLGSLFEAACELAREEKLDKGFRLVVNSGDHGGQTVYHLHIHLLGGRNMHWPPG